MLQKCLLFPLAIFVFMGCNNDVEKQTQSTQSSAWFEEPFRPQIHFTPKANWMNDPNGMVYYDGEYHLFYQYYPDSTVWGPMHWGHAISTDLVHWEHLPVALYPDSLGYIFSGSAVVDTRNSSGLGKDGQPPLIAFFTHHDPLGEKEGTNDYQYQSIAYSNDKGRTWIKYEGNPVVPNDKNIRDFRDPKVIWDVMHQQWVLVLAAADRVQFWTSQNLLDWEFASEFGEGIGGHGGVWECPDIFPIRVTETGDTKWMLLVSINPGGPNGGSATQYFVGDFDGRNFLIEPSFLKKIQEDGPAWIDYGRDNYAGVTWSDIPEQDGRRIFLGWMSNWEYAQVVPTVNWRSAMTIPRVLSLHYEDAYFLKTNPVEELQNLYIKDTPAEEVALDEGTVEIPNPAHLQIELPEGKRSDWQLVFSNEEGAVYTFSFKRDSSLFTSDRTRSGATDFSEKFAGEVHLGKREAQEYEMDLNIYLDHTSIEIFVDDGRTAFTEIFFPKTPFDKVELKGESGSLRSYALESIWK
jgi:fructan beta-fructosidase